MNYREISLNVILQKLKSHFRIKGCVDKLTLAPLCNGSDAKLVCFYYQTKNQWWELIEIQEFEQILCCCDIVIMYRYFCPD